jgi:hypothetical protein
MISICSPITAQTVFAAERTTGDIHDDRPDDSNDRPIGNAPEGQANPVDISNFPSDETRAWATSYGFDLDSFMNPPDPTAIAPHEPTADDIELFERWISSGGNPRNMIMKAVSEAIGEDIANQLWNYMNTAFWSGFMNKANVGSVVSETSGLKNVGAIQEGQFAAYFGSYFPNLMSGGNDRPNDGNTGDTNGDQSSGYQYEPAVTLINNGYLVSSDDVTWRLHNAADGSIAYEIAASDVQSDRPQSFTLIVDENGDTYWQAGMDSAEKLRQKFSLVDDGTNIAVSVLPDNDEKYPYLYPDLPWNTVIDGDKPAWYGTAQEYAVETAFEEWKAFAYDFDLAELMRYFDNISLDPVTPTDEDIDLLKQWAIYKSDSAGADNKGADSTEPWAGDSIYNDAAQWLNDTFGEVYGQCPGPTVCHGIETALGIELDPATEDELGSSVGEKEFVGSYFTNTTTWSASGSSEYPYWACADLWKRGLIPSFDGAKWRLSSGKDGTVVYEIAAEELLASSDTTNSPDAMNNNTTAIVIAVCAAAAILACIAVLVVVRRRKRGA